MSDTAASTPKGAVLVTGAFSGIGRATTLKLADAGFHVLAGMHRRHHLDTLETKGPGRITPLLMDITDADHLDQAVRDAEQALGDGPPTPLVGLVNNAGISVTGPMEAVPLDSIRRQFEVNFIGQIAVVQTFLPLLRRGGDGARIVNIGSVGGWVTMPFGGPLCGSKHAFKSVNDAMRMELAPSGIRVVLIEPGAINTPAVDEMEQSIEPSVAEWTDEQRERYADAYRAWSVKAVHNERAGAGPEVVAGAVLKALTASRPRTRYPVGPLSRPLSLLARTLPNPVFDPLRMKVLGLAAFAKGRPVQAPAPVSGAPVKS